MKVRQSRSDEPLRPEAQFMIEAMQLPSFRVALAHQEGVQKNLLFTTWGGIGDIICAEPTIRYAVEKFKDCKISLVTRHPEFFEHLPLAKVYVDGVDEIDPNKYLILHTNVPPESIIGEFYMHMLGHCVDFSSICALKMQLPVEYRQIRYRDTWPISDSVVESLPRKRVVLHPGKHWPSKTFPTDWWNDVITILDYNGIKPILIGQDLTPTQGTVAVDPRKCLDLRNKLSLKETATLLRAGTDVLLTNDSAPLHMAAPGDAWIGFIATCKHPSYITHWRHNMWSWRMENLGKGGMWDLQNYCPNQADTIIRADTVDEKTLLSWLPTPKEYSNWALEKLELKR